MAMKPIEILINAKDNASAVFDGLNGKLKVIGAAIAGYFGVQAFAGVIKGAAEFEQGMSRVQAATGATATEMAELRKVAQETGANTKFTSTEAAGALENLAKAGLSAKDAIATLPAVLNLAQAGDVDLATASEYVTKAVMGMGLAFTDAARVADVLALGANATNTSVSGLAQALSYAAPVAQSAGVSLEGTVAIMGKLADAGIDASRSGTAVANMLAQFSDPASTFKRELAAAGITTNNFEEALHQLAVAGPRGEKAILAVGLNAGPALRALLNQGMGSLDELKTKLEGAAGSAEATAKIMRDNLNGSLKGLESAWKTVTDALGTPVLPVIRDAVDQLSASFKNAVADGTIGKFGDAIAIAFQAGIKWAREFLAQVDFTQVATDMRAFADRSGEVFTQIGEYATNAGNIVKLAYGVMASGVNAILAGIYSVGANWSTTAEIIMLGIAKLRDGLAKITFGEMSENFKRAADDARSAAEGFGDAAKAMRDKANQALEDIGKNSDLAAEGFKGLARSMDDVKPAATAAARAFDDMGKKLEETRQKSQAAQKATDEKRQADIAAATAIRQLKDEYGALVASGNVQAAAEKFEEINKVLRATPAAAKDSAKAAEDAAKQIAAAFVRQGVVSSEALATQAATSLKDYELIKNAGTSSAQDIGNMFKKAAEDAIAANKGIAPSWVQAEAGVRGFKIEVDEAGKSILKAMGDGKKAVAGLGEQWKMTAEQIKVNEEAMDRLMMKYTLSADYTERQLTLLEKENALIERREALEDKRLNRDKEGFSLNTGGQRVAMDVQSRRSVFENAKGQGLTEAQALEIANAFINDNNQKTGGAGAISSKGENWGTELQRAIDQQVLANAASNAAGGAAGGAQTTDPRMGQATTVNINLNGSTRTINTDQAGASTLQDLLGELAQARRTSSY